MDGLKQTLFNTHVVLKFTRSGAKTESVWVKGQQLMGHKLLSEGIASDFIIKAGGKQFPCHKCFLAGRSSVFARMFETNMVEVEDQSITMEDISPEGVEAFLKYMYTGSLVDTMDDVSFSFELLQASHKYEVKDLEFVCKKILESAETKMFDAELAFEMYKFCGNVDGLEALKSKAARIFKENAAKFQQTGEIVKLLESYETEFNRVAFAEWMCNSHQSAT